MNCLKNNSSRNGNTIQKSENEQNLGDLITIPRNINKAIDKAFPIKK